MDDVSDFNFVRFMEKYNLKTIANEAMVIEEYKVFAEEKGYFYETRS